MFGNIAPLLVTFSLSLYASPLLENVRFEGNEKISAERLNTLVKTHLGKTLDASNASAIAAEVEAFYRKNNFSLAHASVRSIDEKTGVVTIAIGKYADFSARAIGEMERRPLKPGTLNRVFFTGNEKITTYRLMKEIEGLLGREYNESTLTELTRTVERHYRKRGYELAYAQIEHSDENGIVTVAVKKYPSFKARYAREGKN